MAYEIACRHDKDPEGETVNRRFETFDDAWETAKILADMRIDACERSLEIAFRKVP